MAGQDRNEPPSRECYLRTIIVPAPWSVNNSRSNTCGSLPSTMCTRGTANNAFRHAVTLGIIPPLMMPSSIRCSASVSVNSEINDPSVRQMPATLLKKMSFSALSAPARCAATRSALMFKQVPLCDCPSGAITGIYPCSINVCTRVGSTDSISTHKPQPFVDNSGANHITVSSTQTNRVAVHL